MRKIQRKYFAKKFIGGIFILLWNLMPASADDELMTYNQDYDGDGVNTSFLKDAAIFADGTAIYRGALSKPRVLSIDTTFTSKLFVNKTERFLYVTQFEDPCVTITVRPCYGEISWSLYFRNTKETGNVDDLAERGTQLYMYQNGDQMRSHFVNNTDLGMGLYIIDITATKENYTAFEILVSQWPREPALFKIADKVSDPRETKIKFDFENNSLSVKIRKDYSENEFSDVQFKLLLHPKKNYNLMCAAEMENNENDRNELLGEHTKPIAGDANSLIFKIDNLVQGRQYYANVYAVGNAGFAVPYASTSFVYKPIKPISLKDGKLMRVNLKDTGGRISFKHKVGNKTTMQRESTNILRIFVIPCGGIVLVEIKHKHAVIEYRKIREFAIFQIENVINRQRYMLKITDLSLNELRKYNNVSVLATIRPKYEPLPSLPTDYTLHIRYNKTERCNGTVSAISWHPIINDEPITYCVSVQERKKDESDEEYDDDNIFDTTIEADPFEKLIDQQRLINQCTVDLSALFSLSSTRCFKKVASNSRQKIVQKLKNLKSDRDYLIQVIARKYKREGAITYKLLRIRKKDICNFH